MSATASHHFLQWLLERPPGESAACHGVLVLHGPAFPGEHPLARRVAGHLNEYDDRGDSPWLAVDEALLEQIAADPGWRRLLGVADSCANCPPASACGRRKILRALAGHGRVVLASPHAPAAVMEIEEAFHVGLHLDPSTFDACHLILNPERVPADCLAGIVGDVFLEWAACRERERRIHIV